MHTSQQDPVCPFASVDDRQLLHRNVRPHSQCSHKQHACALALPGHVVLAATASVMLQGFQSVYKPKRSGTVSFAELLDAVAGVDPEMRIRFTSPHPKEFSDEVLQVSPKSKSQ